MLRIGLTGGIGSGKSTVGRLLAKRGARVIDADQIAREVVEPGTRGLAAIRERFGEGVITPRGALDRAALGAIVFADPQSRRALEEITHPLIRARTLALMESAAPQTVVVHDIPLLVEIGAAATYHLVVIVDVDAEERVRRLTGSRGLAEADARARIANQASREERLAAADVVIDNNGAAAGLVPQVDALWERLISYDARLRAGEPVVGPAPMVDPDPSWPDQARRSLARLAHVLSPLLGPELVLDHVGPTAVAGVPAPDVLHLQLGLASATVADRTDVRTALAGLGHPRSTAGAPASDERLHLSCDPGRRVEVQLRTTGAHPWRTALLARDWLRADTSALEGLIPALRGPETGDPAPTAAGGFPAEWWAVVSARAEAWAARTGWAPRR